MCRRDSTFNATAKMRWKNALLMQTKMTCAFLVWLFPLYFCSLSKVAYGRVEIFVKATGLDSNNGNQSSPVRTIEKAQELSRIELSRGNAVTIKICAGSWFMDRPLLLNEFDSGPSVNEPTIYTTCGDGATILTGGISFIGGWKKTSRAKEFYRSLPGLGLPRDTSIRQAYFNGRLLTRARSELLPDGGGLTFAQLSQKKPTSDSIKSWGIELDQFSLRMEFPDSIEFIGLENWYSIQCKVRSIGSGGKKVYLERDCWDRVYEKNRKTNLLLGAVTWFENHRSFIDEEDEWYFESKNGHFFLHPRSTDSLQTSTLTIPLRETLIEIAGSSLDHPAQNIRIEGLVLESTTWNRSTSFGYSSVQAGYAQMKGESGSIKSGLNPAAIEVSFAKEIEIRKNNIRNLGSDGVAFKEGVVDSSIQSNFIHQIAGSGISVAPFWIPSADLRSATRNILVFDNLVERTGVTYQDSVGIKAGIVSKLKIRKNTIRKVPYSAISVGWGWDWQPVRNLRDNIIEYNRVEDFMLTQADGGGIYTLSNQPGTIIRYNFIRSGGLGLKAKNKFAVRQNLTTPSVPIYLDSGSSHIKVYHNYFQDMPFVDHGANVPANGVWGPQIIKPRGESPCGRKACFIDSFANGKLVPGNPAHMKVLHHSGSSIK